MNKKSLQVIGGILIIGLVLASLILTLDVSTVSDEEHGESAGHSEAFPRGPHRGRLLSNDGFALEVTIYETGVPPQFRVYAYQDDKPLPPGQVQLEITLHRFGGRIERIQFKPEADYLLGNAVIQEPHSFDVSIDAGFDGKTFPFSYSQVEGRIQMNAASLQSAGITLETAGPAKIESVLKLPGTIEFDKNRLAHVVPRVGGEGVHGSVTLVERCTTTPA